MFLKSKSFGDLDGNINAGGYGDGFVAKYDTSGSKKWTRLLGTSDSDGGTGIAVNADGNIYITGDTLGDLDGKSNSGFAVIFVAKYDANGTKQWTRLLGSTNRDTGHGIAVDSNGNIYVTGVSDEDLAGNTNAGVSDMFVWKIAPRIAGAMPWVFLLLDKEAFALRSSSFSNGASIPVSHSLQGGNLSQPLS